MSGATGRGEREDEEEDCTGVYDEGGPFRPRPDAFGSSLGVRRWVRDEDEDGRCAPSECRLCASEELPRVGDELCERWPEPGLRGPYCCRTNGGVGGNRGMSTYGITGTCIIGMPTGIMGTLTGIAGTGGTPHG